MGMISVVGTFCVQYDLINNQSVSHFPCDHFEILHVVWASPSNSILYTTVCIGVDKCGASPGHVFRHRKKNSFRSQSYSGCIEWRVFFSFIFCVGDIKTWENWIYIHVGSFHRWKFEKSRYKTSGHPLVAFPLAIKYNLWRFC